jgi:hypothetical protein
MRRRKRIVRDACGCGCEEPRRYPIGPTMLEARLMSILLREHLNRGGLYAAAAERLLAKIDHAVSNASRGVAR